MGLLTSPVGISHCFAGAYDLVESNFDVHSHVYAIMMFVGIFIALVGGCTVLSSLLDFKDLKEFLDCVDFFLPSKCF